MKKLLVLAFILIALPCMAEPQQSVKNDQAYFMANLQKQPQTSEQQQKITNHFTFFTINVQINGKIKDTDNAVK